MKFAVQNSDSKVSCKFHSCSTNLTAYEICCSAVIIIIIIVSLTPVSSSYEDIGASLPCNHVILPEWSDVGYAWKRGVHSECVGRNLSETLCRLLITMVEETFDISRFWVDHGRPVMNLKSGYVEGENSKWKVKQRKMICGPFLIGCQAQ